MLQLIILKEGEDKIMKRASIIFTVFILTMPIFARPSWCRSAHTYVEKRICHNRYLMELDYELADVYYTLRDILKRADRSLYREFVQNERDWIRERNTDCYGMPDSCIERKYQERIEALHYLLRKIREME
jgi:uncharacterized protein